MGLQQNRRSFLAKSIELVSTIPLIGLIIENFANRTSYYEINSTGAQASKSPHPALDELVGLNASIGGSLDNLNSAYSDAYRKRHVRMVPYTYRVGKNTMHGVRAETYYRWEEPSNVPNHSVIENWKSSHSNFSYRVNKLSQGATIDLEKLKELSVIRQRTDTGREGLVSLAVYSPQIAALLFYEEAIAKIKHGDEEHASAGELVDRHDTQPQITRRSFFKVGAALAGAFVASPIVLHNREQREEGRNKLNAEIERMRKFGEISEPEAFSQYFEVTPSQLVGQYRNQIRLSSDTIQGEIQDERVKTSFLNFIKTGREDVNSLDNLIGKEVPREIGNLIKSTLIARNLSDKSSSEHRAVYTGLGLTGLAVAGAIAATLIPLELGNEYCANKFEKDRSSTEF